MNRFLHFLLGSGVLMACSQLPVHASVLTFTLGSAAPSFTDGQTAIGTATYNTAVAGNAAPFNGFIGSDVSGPNFSAAWAYNYGSIGSPIASATLTLGLFDGDSSAAGNQVGAFTVGGVDLTALLNGALEAHGGASGEYDIYTITLPATTFASLAGGTPALSLALQSGAGILGPTAFNGAGLDFSKLTITTGATGQVPEPATWMTLGAGLAAAALRRRFRRA